MLNMFDSFVWMIRLDRNGVNDRDSCLFVDAALSVMINNERAAADEIHEDVFTVFQLSVMKRCGLILLLLSGLWTHLSRLIYSLNKTFDIRKSKKAQSELLHRDYFKGVCKRASSSHRNTRTISKDLCHVN